MRNGIYTIDSIEKGQAKLLWREDESIEELVPAEKLGYPVRAGDLVEVKSKDNELVFEYQQDKTAAIKEQARKLKEELLKRDQ